MRFFMTRAWLLVPAVLAGLAAAAAPAAADEKKQEKKAADEKKADEGFIDLFNGKDFTGLKMIVKTKDADPKETFTVKDGIIVVTGQPYGYFYTEKSYKNYIIRYDWKYKRPEGLTDDSKFLGNSGLLVHMQEPHKVWPKCVEVQGMNRDHGKLLFVAGAKGSEKFDREARNKAVKPVGEWNMTEAVCNADGSITVKINGTDVNSGKSDLTDGLIGFQSEGAEIHFRNIKIKEMK